MDGWYYSVKIKKNEVENVEKVGILEFEEFIGGEECDEVYYKEENGNNIVIMVSVEEIMPNKAQPRRVFDNLALEELSESIRIHGVIQPIVVRRCDEIVGSVFKYELIAGERRLRACKMAGIELIPCVLLDVGEEKSAELSIIENLHRKDLNVFETAEAISSLINVYGLTQEEVAAKLSVTQSAVANKLRLLRLSGAERELILANNLTERHARGLLRVIDGDLRMEVLKSVIDKGMNVKVAEEYIESVLSGLDVDKVGKSECFEGGRCKNYINVIQISWSVCKSNRFNRISFISISFPVMI